MYDPYVGAGGYSPNYYTALAGLYMYYRVYACKYEIILTNRSTTESVRIGTFVSTSEASCSSF